ncbi:MAG: tetratricopeptide repeat protein, partial [Fibrobacterota bacterium]
YTNIVVEHRGYYDQTVSIEKQKRNRRLLEMELQEHPGEPFLTYSLAGALASSGKIDKAVSLYRETILAVKKTGKKKLLAEAALIKLIEIFYGSDKNLASKYSRQLNSVNPESPPALYYSARILDDSGDKTGAAKKYKKLIDLGEKQSIIPVDINQMRAGSAIGLAKIAASEGDSESQKNYLLKAMEIKEGSPLPHYKKGDFFARITRNSEAEEEYYKGIDKGEPESFCGLADLLQREGNNTGAETVLNKALEIFPENRLIKEKYTSVTGRNVP